MADIVEDAYEFEQVDGCKSNIKYDFVSIGEKEVAKRVAIIQFTHPGLEKYFNLGFGNISIDNLGNETVSDMSRDNNKDDKNKVLMTVMTCALEYLSTSTGSILTFYGNTHAKHRLYKSAINKNIEDIQKYFVIKGGILKDLELIETVEGSKTPNSPVNLNDIVYETYDPTKSRDYTFITLELNDEFK